MQIDIFLLQILNSFALQNDWARGFFIFFADYADVLVVIFAVLFLFFISLRSETSLPARIRQIAQPFAFSAIAWGIGEIVKQLISRARPFIDGLAENLINYPEKWDSFPSGHAIFFIALGFAIYYRDKRAGIFFLICAIVIAIARVTVGIHYPSDILAGGALGALFVWIFRKFRIFS